MIDLGGQLAVSGLPPGATAWRVGLAHPLDRSREVLALALPSGSLYADALSTALYLMGPDEGLPWAASLDLPVAYLIPDGDDVRVRATPAFEPLFDGRPGLRTSTQ